MSAIPILNSTTIAPNPAAALEPRTWHAVLSRLCEVLSRSLHSLRAGVDLLREDIGGVDDQDHQEHLRQMATVCDDLLELTRMYLIFSGTRPEIYRPRLGTYTLSSLLRDFDGEFSAFARGNGLRWSCGGEGEDRQVVTDASLCQWIVRILIDNAFEHTRPGDEVRVRAWGAAPADGGPERSRDVWCLQVVDTGTGIAAEALERVFEPFYRAPREKAPEGAAAPHPSGSPVTRRGLGLGLPVCRAMVQRLGGEIEIASALGHGTTVTVRLPADPV